MKSLTTKHEIKKLIPVLSKKERQEIVAYYTVYEKYEQEFSKQATKDLENHPVFGKIIKDIPKEVSTANNKVSRDLQKDAIINDNWQPYIEYQIEQGVTYAKMGLDFKSWYEVVAMARNYLRPYIHKEYGSGDKYLSAINGMNLFMDIAMSIIGEAYMQEKKEIIKADREVIKKQNEELEQKVIDRTAQLQKSLKEISDYKHALDESSIVAITNSKGIITYVNDNFCNISKYNREELIGQDHRFISSGYHSNEFFRDLWITISNSKIWSGEVKNKAKDGTIYWLDTTIVPFLNEEGKPYQYLAIRSDITERKKAEQKEIDRAAELDNKIHQLKESEEKLEIQNSLLTSTITSYKDILIFSIDKKYQYLIFNEAFKAATQQAYGTQVSAGINMLDGITNEDDRKKAKDNCDRALAGEAHMTLEVYGDLARYYYETRYNPITDDSGQVIGVTVMSANVTERIRSEEQLIELNKELESFSYSVSHDLRAPLRAIDGYAGILEEDYEKILDDEGKRLLEAVKYNEKKMGNLIDDLLTFSRIGKKELTKTDLHMNELVEGALYELNKSIKHQAKVKINYLYPAKGDYGLINQVVINLLSNAIKYSAKVKEPLIEISSEKNDNEIIYSIKDNGAGFDMRYVHKLFGVFQRLHTADEFEGTGVGLAIVQRIMTKHGGKVWAEGEKNKGATFKFSLPVN